MEGNLMQAFLMLVMCTAAGLSIRLPLRRGDAPWQRSCGELRAVKFISAAVLILFCMGGSYVLAAAITALTGFGFPWVLASVIMAVGVRSTTELPDREFPDGEGVILGAVSLLALLAVTVSA